MKLWADVIDTAARRRVAKKRGVSITTVIAAAWLQKCRHVVTIVIVGCFVLLMLLVLLLLLYVGHVFQQSSSNPIKRKISKQG